jgi:hypothetical protein
MNRKCETHEGHLNKNNNRWRHMLGTQILFVKVLGLPTFTYGAKIWGGELRNHLWKVFEKV